MIAFSAMTARLATCVALGAALIILPAGLQAQVGDSTPIRRVEYEELVQAMRIDRAKGYALDATSNGARFAAAIFLSVIEVAREKDPAKSRLFIDHRDNLAAYMAVTELPLEKVPTFVRLSAQYRQDQLVDYGRDSVAIDSGHPRPYLAIRVTASWPDSAGLPKKYSYHDTLSDPNLKVTNQRVVTYRLLYFDDMIVYDDIRGVRGRPTSGALGLLFAVIGDGRAVQSRLAISRDGLQITYSVARKGPFTVDPTATVFPDGRIQKEVPRRRPDLEEIAARLRRPLRIKYVRSGPSLAYNPRWPAGGARPSASSAVP